MQPPPVPGCTRAHLPADEQCTLNPGAQDLSDFVRLGGLLVVMPSSGDTDARRLVEVAIKPPP